MGKYKGVQQTRLPEGSREEEPSCTQTLGLSSAPAGREDPEGPPSTILCFQAPGSQADSQLSWQDRELVPTAGTMAAEWTLPQLFPLKLFRGRLGRLSTPRHFLHSIPFIKTPREEAGIATSTLPCSQARAQRYSEGDSQRASGSRHVQRPFPEALVEALASDSCLAVFKAAPP